MRSNFTGTSTLEFLFLKTGRRSRFFLSRNKKVLDKSGLVCYTIIRKREGKPDKPERIIKMKVYVVTEYYTDAFRGVYKTREEAEKVGGEVIECEVE